MSSPIVLPTSAKGQLFVHGTFFFSRPRVLNVNPATLGIEKRLADYAGARRKREAVSEILFFAIVSKLRWWTLLRRVTSLQVLLISIFVWILRFSAMGSRWQAAVGEVFERLTHAGVRVVEHCG